MKIVYTFIFVVLYTLSLSAQINPFITKWKTNNKDKNWQIKGDSSGMCQIMPVGGAFITKWKTDNQGTSCESCITIPTYSSEVYDYSIDLDNDGLIDTSGITGDFTYDFGEPGIYTIGITGDFPGVNFNFEGDKEKILDIVQWGDIEWKRMNASYKGCVNLVSTAADTPDLTAVERTDFMFFLATSFVADLSDWDMSSITNTSYMFHSAHSFISDLNNWNVSNVQNMEYMFNDAFEFNSDLSNWDVSNVQTMSWMFGNAHSFNGDLSTWDVSNVKNMAFMFNRCDVFNQDISKWNVYNVQDMVAMFSKAYSFDCNLGDWNVWMVKNFESMFDYSGMSCENYSNTLIGWANNEELPTNMYVGAKEIFYDKVNGAEARTKLMEEKNWSFTGDMPGNCTVSIYENEYFSIQVYPTVANDYVHVISDADLQFYLYNQNGILMKRGKCDNSIDISEFSPGMYFLHLSEKGATMFTTKIVKI